MVRTFRVLLVFLLVLAWVFSGWPQVWNFPPEIQEAQAAVSSVGSAVNSSSPNAGTTVTLPGGMNTDDLIIVAAAVGDTADNGMAAPTEGGYTRIGTATIYSNDVNDVNLDMYYKFHNGSDTTVSFGAVGGANASNIAVVMVFRGVDTSSPFDTTVSTSSNINSSNADPPSHNWSGAAGVWTVAVGATGHTGGATATFTAPAGYTTDFAQRAHNDTIDALVGVGYKSSPSDPEDPGAFTAATIGTAADNAWVAATISLKPLPPSTTLGTGTDPSAATIAPGAVATTSDAFTFQTSTSTDAITNVTTTLAGTGNYAGLSRVEIVDSASTTVYGSVTNPASDAFPISLSGLTASTTLQNYQIRITPKSHADMPAPPGALYVVTSTITDWTGTNTHAGSDSGSATITIDNLSPSDVTNASGTASLGQVALSWTNPADSDFTQTVVLRATSSVGHSPTEGTTYSVGNTIGTSTVACVVNTPSSSCTDTGVVNGTTYYYKIFTRDTSVNYSASGAIPSGGPFTPGATVSCSTNVSSVSFGTLATSSIATASPNASTTMTCTFGAGCTLNVSDAGNGSSPGLATSSPAYLIPSATVTLSAGTEGYGIQAATTTVGSGGQLGINSVYLKAGNNVGGLSLATVLLASSTAAVTDREVVVTHKAAISGLTNAGSYTDTITYSCVGN